MRSSDHRELRDLRKSRQTYQTQCHKGWALTRSSKMSLLTCPQAFPMIVNCKNALEPKQPTQMTSQMGEKSHFLPVFTQFSSKHSPN